jgi:hypothetical protein
MSGATGTCGKEMASNINVIAAAAFVDELEARRGFGW